MKRDMDLIRFILLSVEFDGELGVPAGHSDEEIADHVQQLIEERLVEGHVQRNHQGIPCAAAIIRDSHPKGTTLQMPHETIAFG
jgi:hypothetical protein